MTENKIQPSGTDAEQNVEREAEQTGTDIEQRGTTMEKHVEQDLGTDETLLNKAVQWKQQGKSYREIENSLGVPKSTLHRYLKRNVPNTRVEPISHVLENNGHETEQFSQQSSPSNVLDKLAYYQKIPAKDAIFQLFKENSRLEAQIRNNGHGSPNISYPNTENPFVTRLMQIAEAKEYKLLLGLDKNDHDDLERKFERLEDKIEKLGSPKEGNIEKTLDVLGKIYDKASGQNQTNPFQVAQSILTLTKEQANIAKGSTNEYDLKHLEMSQLGHLEDQKLAWEIEKYRDQKQGSADTINAIKDIFKEVSAGPIGKFIGGAGEGMKNRIEGGPRLPRVDVSCPNCGNKFKANPSLDVVICNGCGASLRKQPEAQAPQPQPQQPTEQASQQEATSQNKPLETEPKGIDTSTDALGGETKK